MTHLRVRRNPIFAAAVLVCVTSTAGWADLTAYSQDFEGLNEHLPSALSADGWLVFGNVYDDSLTGTYLYGYGPDPAPNGGEAFSAVETGQGGVEQGTKQLSVYNDYNNGTEHIEGNIVEANVFQEQTIGLPDVGKTYEFLFDAKMGNLTGNSTAVAFIKTLDPSAGFALTNFITVDMTSIPISWGTYSMRIPIAPSLNGQLLQFGFLSTATNFEGSGVFYDNVEFFEATSSSALPAPRTFALHQNVPNPFNPATRIAFDLTRPGNVDVSVFDATGRKVSTLLHQRLDSGPHFVNWNGLGDDGRPVAAGVYRYVLTTSKGRTSRSMVLLK